MPETLTLTKPLVSIVVTSYNHAEYLDQRMKSLLLQTYGNLEIIVVDDHSTDGSAEVFDKYRKYPHVYITILAENGGYARACNYGVKISNGDYIMFAECDDFNDPIYVEIRMEKMLQNPHVGVGYCRSNMVNANGFVYGVDFQYREKAFQSFCYKDVLIPHAIVRKFFLFSCIIPNMSAAIIRKNYFKSIGGFNPRYKACADWDFWCRIAEKCDFYYIAKPLNFFRNHASTVRNNMGAITPTLEIYNILYREGSNIELSLNETIKFKLAMGSIWAQQIARNPKEWLLSLSETCLKSMKYDFFIFPYMLTALIREFAFFLLKKTFNRNAI